MLHGMGSASAVINRSPEHCWRALTDATLLPIWVPGLRRARVIDAGTDGLAREVAFEFSSSLTYSLIYTYDAATLCVRWEPRIGKRDGVRGFARLEPVDGGTRMTYSLEQGDGRNAADQSLGDPAMLIDAFARWVESQPLSMFTPRSMR